MSRCTGHCCKRFYLPLTPTQIQGEAELVKLGGRSRFNPKDIVKIAEMIIPLEAEERDYKPVPEFSNMPYHEEPRAYFYTCKYHNKETGDCMNYDNRPDLCRNYPYGGICNYKGCTYGYEKELNAKKMVLDKVKLNVLG